MLMRLLFILLCALSAWGTWVGLRRRFGDLRQRRNDLRLDDVGRRLWRLVTEVLLQVRVIRNRPLVGLLHALVVWGFIAFVWVSIRHVWAGLFGLDQAPGPGGRVPQLRRGVGGAGGGRHPRPGVPALRAPPARPGRAFLVVRRRGRAHRRPHGHVPAGLVGDGPARVRPVAGRLVAPLAGAPGVSAAHRPLEAPAPGPGAGGRLLPLGDDQPDAAAGPGPGELREGDARPGPRGPRPAPVEGRGGLERLRGVRALHGRLSRAPLRRHPEPQGGHPPDAARPREGRHDHRRQRRGGRRGSRVGHRGRPGAVLRLRRVRGGLPGRHRARGPEDPRPPPRARQQRASRRQADPQDLRQDAEGPPQPVGTAGGPAHELRRRREAPDLRRRRRGALLDGVRDQLRPPRPGGRPRHGQDPGRLGRRLGGPGAGDLLRRARPPAGQRGALPGALREGGRLLQAPRRQEHRHLLSALHRDAGRRLPPRGGLRGAGHPGDAPHGVHRRDDAPPAPGPGRRDRRLPRPVQPRPRPQRHRGAEGGPRSLRGAPGGGAGARPRGDVLRRRRGTSVRHRREQGGLRPAHA